MKNGLFLATAPVDIPQTVEALKLSVSAFSPELCLSGLFLIIVLLDLVLKSGRRKVIPAVAIVGFFVTGYFVFQQHSLEFGNYFLGMHAVDPFALFFKYLFLFSGILAILISLSSEELTKSATRSLGEYYAIVVAMVLGMFLMASASDMLMMYLSLELVSLSSYVLTGYLKGNIRSSEASLKYIIYGSVSSGLMIYGISILYGLTGVTNIYAISDFLRIHDVDSVALLLSLLLIMGGFGYKIGAVPFHFWSPDVYEGAPTPVTAFLSVGSKAAGFAMLIRFLRVSFPSGANEIGLDWVGLLSLLALTSMILGNFVAVWQTNVKRILAYSSIAHAGYILLGVLVADDLGTQAVLFYLTAYTVMNIGAFFVIILISNKIGSDDINDYKGLGKRMPILAAALTVFLISLTGLPPTVGFIGKYMIFSALLSKGSTFVLLATAGILTSVVSLYYYFKIPLNMYLKESESGNQSPIEFGILQNALVSFLMIMIFVMGVYFAPLSNLAKYSVSILGLLN
ncbi:MAG: NADH-quinone oxidoreductase subunit N [Chloroherpetonaceae bacterium]|nr:NADH-quinone oxidoreductase subunit N [Chloroherpetonaceae bacterium]